MRSPTHNHDRADEKSPADILNDLVQHDLGHALHQFNEEFNRIRGKLVDTFRELANHVERLNPLDINVPKKAKAATPACRQHAPNVELRSNSKRPSEPLPTTEIHARLSTRGMETLADFDRLVELEPGNALAWNERGLVLASKGSYDDAVRSYARALAVDPDLVLARYNRGIAYRLKGNYELAGADFGAVLRLKPRNHQAYVNRGMCYFARGSFDKAVADFKRAQQLLPGSKEVARRLAEARTALKDEQATGAQAEANSKQPSRTLTVQCPDCGTLGKVNWDRLDHLFQCKACQSVCRADGTGRLVLVEEQEEAVDLSKSQPSKAPATMKPRAVPRPAAEKPKPALTPSAAIRAATAEASAAVTAKDRPTPVPRCAPRRRGRKGRRRYLIAAVLLGLLLVPISMVYGLQKNTAPPRWHRFNVPKLCTTIAELHPEEKSFQAARTEASGYIQTVSESEFILAGGIDQHIVCAIDSYALSTKKLLPKLKAGDYVIVQGRFKSAASNALTLEDVTLSLVETNPRVRFPQLGPVFVWR